MNELFFAARTKFVLFLLYPTQSIALSYSDPRGGFFGPHLSTQRIMHDGTCVDYKQP